MAWTDPPGTHSLFTHFQKWLLSITKSKMKQHMVFGSRPDILNFSTGNILLLLLVTITWLVSSLKCSHI